MDELIGRLVTNVGIDRAAAEKAAGITLDFLAKQGPADKVGAGLSMDEVQNVTQQFIAHASEKVGEDEVGEFVAAIPGLAQFV